jgi:hypothetical protein
LTRLGLFFRNESVSKAKLGEARFVHHKDPIQKDLKPCVPVICSKYAYRFRCRRGRVTNCRQSVQLRVQVATQPKLSQLPLAIKLVKRKKLQQAAAANQAAVPNKLAVAVMAADVCSGAVKNAPFLPGISAARVLIVAVKGTRLSVQNYFWKNQSLEDQQLESGLTRRGPIAIAATKGASRVRGDCLVTSALGVISLVPCSLMVDRAVQAMEA